MTRVHIICEGQTEEMFIGEILSEHFAGKKIFLAPALLGRPGHKGGKISFERLFLDIRNRLGDTESYCTTIFDFYALSKDFPGKPEAVSKNTAREKAACVKKALKERLDAGIKSQAMMERFIPYVQMHEFESMLFSSPEKFAKGIQQERLAGRLRRIRDEFSTPEDINDSPVTAPSKRLIKIIPGYEKPLYGSLAAIEIGLPTIRKECPLFNEWVTQMENLKDIRQEC